MNFKITSLVALLAFADAAPVKEDVAQVSEDNEVAEHRGRSLFPILIKCAFHGCSATGPRARSAARSPSGKEIVMSASEANIVKGPVKALEMLALNDDLNTVVMSNDMCTRRNAMARAAGLAAGLALSAVNAPGFAAETKMVKMGSDSGQLVFVPDEIKICKGDTVTWVNNKGGPHNVVFDEEAIPSGVSVESISMDGQLGDEGETFSKTFNTAGDYSYYCEPHRGAGMNAQLIVS
jgi:plastocyanin|eukprot:CAMPEP_0119374582 /NCGR_PEP_ID=MMETSP1334-20130426/31421_1 /TAXON_ID=127549 /ORGANISM="Calcidiscus leptoporus, Strain RCC1130" /LENGTH=235 /DNA_ID=CAMNT_0007392679 /DNA_START=53 /DNA_END=760 /DNA_ORIENTATION=+